MAALPPSLSKARPAIDLPPPPRVRAVDRRLLALFGVLGFSAGLPFAMFATVLSLWLVERGVGVAVIGFFVWVTLLPTLKFLWAPAIDRVAVPGFAGLWGKRRGWIMLAQTGIVASTAALGLVGGTASLPVVALFATLLAFWTTTLEVAADGWRIELAEGEAAQGPLAAANVWGYRTAMVAAGSGALLIADRLGWSAAYLSVAVVAALVLPVLAATRPEHPGSRGRAVAVGLVASAVVLVVVAAGFAGVGAVLLRIAAAAGVSGASNVTPVVLGLCLIPFLAMAVAIPRIRRMGPEAPLRASALVGPYVDVFWRFGAGALAILAFVSLYRMGDVLALALSKVLPRQIGYSLSAIGMADGLVAVAASMAGVGLGGWLSTRWPQAWTLAAGAMLAAIGNWGFVWLASQPPATGALYLVTAADQFGNGFAGTVFVVYLSMLVDRRFPAAQYAFLSGFAFLLPRLLAGASGSMQARIGYDGFFLLSGGLSAGAILLLPLVMQLRPRADGRPDIAR